MHILVGELQLKLQNELVDNAGNNVGWQITKWHGCIQTVAEFGRKHLFDGLVSSIFLADVIAETNAFFGHVAGTRIGCHN